VLIALVSIWIGPLRPPSLLGIISWIRDGEPIGPRAPPSRPRAGIAWAGGGDDGYVWSIWARRSAASPLRC